MQNAITIPFHGDKLYLIEHQGQPYTPMKPIVEGMGLAWQPQHRKFSSNTERWGITIMVMQLPGDIQKREVLFMPVRKLIGWMMTVSPNRVKPEIRDKVIQYQNECDDILWEHWSKKNQLFQSISTQAVDKIISLNHLETICEYRRTAAACLYFFLQNEQSDWSVDGWFNMSCRDLEQHVDFSFTGIGTALNYLYKNKLIDRKLNWGQNPPYLYRINHKVLKQKLRQYRLPAVH